MQVSQVRDAKQEVPERDLPLWQCPGWTTRAPRAWAEWEITLWSKILSMRVDGEADSKNLEKWQDGRLLRHLGGSCGLRVGLDRCLDGPEQQRHNRLPCGRALQRGRWHIPDGLEN